jgi:diguanylate cyclase (GGDEF)-like protein
MKLAGGGRVWIAGSGGLYEITTADDRVVSMSRVPDDDIQDSTAVALLVDHRGWLWVGTGRGVSVFNGARWVSVNTDSGLVWNDVSQGGIFEDRSGSVWIMTSRGLSHLVDPSWLFRDRPLQVVITDARLGERELPSGKLIAYSREPLSFDFGTFSYADAHSILFHYKMTGVDQSWVLTANGTARYAFIPPGRHRLTVFGENTLNHQVSPPVSLSIRMAYPWWRRGWVEALGSLAVLGLLYAWAKGRERAGRIRQRALEDLVEERTRDMALAQAELRRQATLDGLTGLLNRAEVQRRLAGGLISGARESLVVALLDLDHFKTINDRHGHLAGDEILRLTGVRVAAILRGDEYAGRYGGEEILVVLRDVDGQGADRILGLHQAIGRAAFHVEGSAIAATCSIGVTWAGSADDWRSLIRRADAALYEAKAAGRDRIVERREDEEVAPSGRSVDR